MTKKDRVPTEHVSSFSKWFESQKLGSFDKYCKKIYDGIPKPAQFEHNPSDFYPDWQNPAFVYKLPNGYVLGENGAVLTPDHQLIWDLSTEWVSSPTKHSVFQRNSLPPVKKHKKTVAVVAGLGSQNYYHWMFDILPRFDLVMKSKIPIDYFVINELNRPYQNETLDILDISKKKLIQSSQDLFIQSKKLIVPSLPGYTTKWAADFLRETFLPLVKDDSTPFGEKIYITRNDAHSRRVLNEDALFPFLSSHGFTKVSLDNMSVLEQIKTFSKAKFIVGPHGAGLTNLAFCNPGTKVVEFFSPNYINPCYWHLGTFYDLNYRPFIGEGIRNEHFALNDPSYWSGEDDIRIDLVQFKQLLTSLL